MTAVNTHKPTVLLVLDGWGDAPPGPGNAISQANTPTWDSLLANFPHTLISGSGADVGLPDGQMGNSEVGHLTLGSGRTIDQDLPRISKAITDGSFFENTVLKKAIATAQQTDRAVHIMGLLSPGGVHSHEEHIFACVRMAHQSGVKRVFVHAFLDGRDTPPQSAEASIKKLEALLSSMPGTHIGTLSGRFYAMDRDKRWDRVERAYQAITEGKAAFYADSALTALQDAYARGETDEFVQPTCIHTEGAAAPFTAGDVVIYMNFRADRARALSYAFTDPAFDGFARTLPSLGTFVCLTEYDKKIGAPVAFTGQTHANILGEYLQDKHCKQLHLAETEKYAHVTFFFNGGRETPFEGEERILIPSPKVATYDLQPEMSAEALTDALVEQILSKKFDFIVCNYANADMVGHTGEIKAAIKAIETLDSCLNRITSALEQVGGEMLITADHGNVECMVAPEGTPHTAHTLSLVPLVYFGKRTFQFKKIEGKLSDIAPTILYLMGLAIPEEMTGQALLW